MKFIKESIIQIIYLLLDTERGQLNIKMKPTKLNTTIGLFKSNKLFTKYLSYKKLWKSFIFLLKVPNIIFLSRSKSNGPMDLWYIHLYPFKVKVK